MGLQKRISKRNFTDTHLVALLKNLSKGSKFWKAVAKRLSAPTNERPVVNVSKLERLGWDRVVVPGKVLGAGHLNKKVEVVAYAFSESAKKKIEKVGGKTRTIAKEFEANPEGKGLKVVI